MKKINLILSLIVIAFTFSCDSDTDNIMAIADEGGLVMNTNSSDGALLGIPNDASDLENSEVSLGSTFLDFNALFNVGSEAGIAKYEIVKTYNGGEEILVGEFTNLPLNLTYSSVDEFVEGTNLTASDLRIGDVFTFIVKVYQTDGDIYNYGPSMGQYSVTVNCSSDLEGDYLVAYGSGDFIHTITEISPGVYELNSMFGWPTQTYTTNISDVCGVVTFDGWVYSNPLSGQGQVQPNGDIVFTGVGVDGVYSGNAYTMIKQ